jgi:hypothetical protein
MYPRLPRRQTAIPPPPPDLDCGDIPHRRFTVGIFRDPQNIRKHENETAKSDLKCPKKNPKSTFS